ncbi:RDD family protein [Plantactinospora siamensis]|uniref:RDD family protein n=1 Tax=Plantactinospora siamensis TaxID=555372 RepID=A0ABV6P732_9ACTN
MTVQPGWYRDPAEPSTQRYWDGEGWIGAPLPVDATPPPGPPPAEPEPAGPAAEPASGPGSPGGAPSGVVGEPGAAPTAPADRPGGTSTGAHPPTGAAAPGWGQGQPPPGWGQGQPPPGWGQGAPSGWPPGTPPPGWGQAPPGWSAGPPPGWTGSPVPPGFRFPEPRPHGLALAALGPRLVARLIDILAVLLLNVVVNGWFVWRYVQEVAPVYREVLRRSMAGDSSTDNLPQAGEQAAGLQIAILLIIVALWFAYEVPAVATTGQTLGKRLMGVKVVSVGADPGLTFGRSMRRWNVLGGVPVFLWVCCVGFVIQFIDSLYPLFDRPLRQALHDKAAQTVVVRVPRPATRAGARENTAQADGAGGADKPQGGSE